MARPREFDRDAALKAALRTFWDRGYEGTSMEDLTAAMSLSRSSLYETFGDKQQLFMEALESYLADTRSRRQAILGGAGSAKERMKDFLQGAVEFLTDEEHPFGCFFTNTATAIGTLNAQIRSIVSEHMKNTEADFVRFFEEAQQCGELGPERDPRALAAFFTAVIRGMAVIARAQGGRRMLEDTVKIALETLD